MTKRSRLKTALALTLLASFLAGCSLPGKPKEATVHYVLNDPGPVQRVPHSHPGVLLIKEMEAPVFYQDTSLTFSRSAGTRGHYQFASWSETPARRLSWLLRQRIEAAGVFASVVPLGAGVLGDYQLNTDLIDFYHDAASPPGAALLILDAELVRRDSASLIEHRVFVAQVPVASFDAPGAADALGLAANQVIDEMVVWLARAVPREGK
jgi:cholesterol transport system auxiliary component